MFVRLETRSLGLLALAAVIGAVAAQPSGSSGSDQVYVVRPGDTLWSIAAARYGDDPREGVWKLEQRNEVEDGLIHPGQRLVLPP